MFTKQQVQQMKEQDLRRLVLIPLLQAMNYQDVQEYHGGREFGKDIVCWKNNDLGNRKNTALVVKAKPVSGKSKIDYATAGEIQTQINQCFGKSYVDPISGSDQTVHQCWVVSNHPISENAVDAIRAGLGNSTYKENVEYVGIVKLWSLIEKYMPLQASLQKLEEVQQDLNTWDSHYRLEAHISDTGIQHTLVEKFPGASQEKPIKISSTFAIPETPEGQELREAVDRFFETGTRVKIPGEYIESLEYSEFFQHVYPAITRDGFLELGSVPNPKPLFLRCDIHCEDGEQLTIDFHLKCTQVGLKEATFVTQSQPIPIKMQMVLRSDSTVSSFEWSFEHEKPLNAHQIFMQHRFMRCFSKPHTVYFTDLETGILYSSKKSEIGLCDPPSDRDMIALEALNTLQNKSGKLIFPPSGVLTDEEDLALRILVALFLTGKLYQTWNRIKLPVTITDDNRETIRQDLKRFESGNVGDLPFSQEEYLQLFGKEYLLGVAKGVLQSAKLENEAEVWAFLDQNIVGELILDYVATDISRVTTEYEDWLPTPSE